MTFNKAEGPGTNIIRAAKHVHKQDDAVTKISTVHDINYQLAKNNKDIRKADVTMLNQLGNAMSKEATVKNFITHPWRTTSNLANEGLAYLGIKGKTIAENIGIPTYGLTHEKTTADQKKFLLKKKNAFVNQL